MEPNRIITRIIGILILLISLLTLRVSILERLTVLSPDNNITSQHFIAAIFFLRTTLILLGLLFVLFPQSIEHAKKLKLAIENKYHSQKMNLPPFSFVATLCFLLAVYLIIIFISHFHALSAIRQMENPEKLGLIADLLNTGIYFYKTFTSTLFTAEVDYSKIDIPIYKLYTKEELIDALNENLPESGLQFVDGSLVLNDNVYKTKVRYRGDTYHHWYFKKKSWRVKLKDEENINGVNKFNIINPKLDSHVDTLLVTTLAEKFGLIAPRTFPVALLVNNKYEGVYHYVDQIDANFIKLQGKPTGDIFYGDLFGDFTRTGTLFTNASNWDIITTYDNNEQRARANIAKLISAVNHQDLKKFYAFFNKHLGDNYLKFYALTTLIDENRVDDSHNHKLYFNPSNSRFEPIVWDLMPFLKNNVPLNNDQSNALFNKINLIPQYVEQRNKFLKQYIDEMPETSLFEHIDAMASLIDYEIQRDTFKDSHTIPWVLTYAEWKKSITELKQSIHERYSFLKQQLDNTTVKLSIINTTDNSFLVFDVAGESGIKINYPLQYKKTTVSTQCHTIFKDINFNYVAENSEAVHYTCENPLAGLNNEQLYPGKGTPLRYVYIITPNFNGLDDSFLNLSNSVTGSKVTPTTNIIASPELLEKLPAAQSIHPWILPKQTPTRIL